MKRNLTQFLNGLRLSLLAGAIVVTLGTLGIRLVANPGGSRPEVKVRVDRGSPSETGIQPRSFAPVVDKVSPSVVKIYATVKGESFNVPGARRGGRLPESPFDEWLPFGRPPGRFRTPDRQGLGSGVIVSPDGYLLTNNHVVEDADEIRVLLGDDRKEFSAKVVGVDPKSDIAVLKIDADDLPAITLGDSDKLRVGDLVLAVGNPFGIGQTVTMGMVSATGRGNMGLDYEDFIQTDAAINPGNSGGALVDLDGRLIGINTAILSRSGGNNGIGFAVPVNLARNVMDSLVANGRVIRGYLGVHIQDVSPELAEAFGHAAGRGALVTQVEPGSPAAKAGIEDGDIITAFDGRDVRDARHLKVLVGQAHPAQELSLAVSREGKAKSFKVRVQESPSTPQLSRRESSPGAERDQLQGVAVADLDSQTRGELRVPRNVNGALVTEVDPDSPAYRAGLREGDVITELDRQTVRDAESAEHIARESRDHRLLLRVWSRGGSRYLVVNPTKAG
jgi:serine protease Do